ncbi:PQQ-binding-like beta-propeller repeat protein [Candidatus Bathyarchaeota archaeon]|nr:PQQ-binding-like beta-propeller repeat protein [Candidatus Bathyarchaeota archaeon]
MKIAKSKTAVSLIALFLMLTIAVSIIAVLPINAQAVQATNISHIYVAASPPVIGLNQGVLLFVWTEDMPPDIGEQSGAVSSPSGRAGWYGITLTVTKPDDTSETIALSYTDSIGGTYYSYTPTDVGTYSFYADFPGAWKNTSASFGMFGPVPATDTWYTPATSPVAEFTVQDEAIQPWVESPLPSGSWTRPISDASRDWYVLLGDYLGGAANVYPAGVGGATTKYSYGVGPESAHILWTKPLYQGGLMDAYYENIGYATSHYQGISFSPIIMGGKIYYSYPNTGHSTQGYLCVDLYSGETLYYANASFTPSFGQVYNYESPNQHGGYSYLWQTGIAGFFGGGTPVTITQEIVQIPQAVLDKAGQLPRQTGPVQTVNLTATPVSMGTVWEMLDGYTGQHVCYIANVSSSGTAVYGKDGSILRYNTVNLGGTNYLQVWNSSHGTMPSSQTGTGAWQWRPMGGTFGGSDAYLGGVAYNYVHDGRDFFSLNVSIPSLLGPRNARVNQTASIRVVREDEYIIFGTTGMNDASGIAPCWMMALSLEPGQEGTKLWEATFTPPYAEVWSAGFFGAGMTMTGVYPEDEVILFYDNIQLIRLGYDMKTGTKLWESEPEGQMNYYGMITNYYQGLLLAAGWSGEVIAYNITTGVKEWVYTASNVGFESPYGNYPINFVGIADGKIYTLTGEHSITQPMWRGPNLRCINATDGTEVWSMLNFGANGGASLTGTYVWLAEGKIVGINFMDNQIYCIGKGNSATSVTASPKVSVHGTSVMIEGTVTDQTSTGRRNTNDLLDWTLKGTPAISDEDMSAWMEYKFQQQGFPADAKGVEVVLTVLDPNSNFYEIGRTTSDVTGAFGYSFEPEVPGTYQITATFEGSRSYGSSFATTYLTVDEAPAATAEPTPPPASMTDTYVLGLGIGAIVAIIAVGLLLFLLLRKR